MNKTWQENKIRMRGQLPYLAFAAVVLGMALLITRGEFRYGSQLDWNSQDYRIPEYFRMMFCHTGNIFQSFDLNTGAGQDIYNLAYYGYLSPVILISYLFPFITMKAYITGAVMVCVFISTALIYKWFSVKFSPQTAVRCALLFELASPLLLQSHRHTMFILYMPFLILAFTGVEKFVQSGRRLQFLLCTFLTIMCNFFFAVSACAAIGIFSIYVIKTEMEGASGKEKTAQLGRIFGNSCIAVLMSQILLLPVMGLLLENRRANTVHYSLSELLVPDLVNGNFLFGNHYIVLTLVTLAASAAGIILNKKGMRFLALVFIVLALAPVITMALNGMMYMDEKVMIPFVPLAMILAAAVTEAITVRRPRVMGASWAVILAAALTSAVIVNLADPLIPLNDASGDAASAALTRTVLTSDKGVYRIGNTVVHDNFNQVYSPGHLTTSIYSSLEDLDYADVWLSDFYNNERNRNSAIIRTTYNPLFNTFMGNRYMVTDKTNMAGYVKKYSLSGLGAFENRYAYPLGFVTYKTINHRAWGRLPAYDRTMALMTCAVTDQGDSRYSAADDYTSAVTLLTPDNYSIAGTKVSRSFSTGRTLIFKKASSTTLHVDAPVGSLLLVSFRVVNENAPSGNSGLGNSAGEQKNDVKIKLDGKLNDLTDPTSRYSNGNSCFRYAVTATSEGDYRLNFSKGKYRISDLKIAVVPQDAIAKARSAISGMENITINRAGTRISGTVNAEKAGYLVVTIPWNSSFTVYIDGSRTACRKTDLAFIGAHVSAGTHKIKIVYNNDIQIIGGIMSLAGVAYLASLLRYDRRRRP